MSMKIKKGDKVAVILGKDKGREAQVEKVYPNSGRVLVKGVNVSKKHVKKSEAFPQGGVVDVPKPLDVSKVMVICPNCKEKTRVGFKVDAKGKKIRFCRKCQQVIK